MKQHFIKLKDLIKRGIVRIFPLPKMVFVIVFVIVSALLISCGSTKMVTQTVRDVHTDTLYLSNVQYDSIYIFKDKLTDRSKDTIYVKDVSVEYRYKLLRDTIYKTQVDSIPYQVTVTEVKEITRPLTWYDHLTRLSFWFLIGSLLTFIIIKLKRVF